MKVGSRREAYVVSMNPTTPSGANVPPSNRPTEPTKEVIRAEDLYERQIRGIELWKKAQQSNGLVIIVNAEEAYYPGSRDRIWKVNRTLRNLRGVMAIEYRCTCPDYKKNGRVDCLHIFADKLRNEDVEVVGEVKAARKAVAVAVRRPARKTFVADGRARRTAQRTARTKMPERVPKLVLGLKQVYDRDNPALRLRRRGRPSHKASTRAQAVVLKVTAGRSADEMRPCYGQHIQDGTLPLPSPPHQNTLTEWMNDPSITPVLESFLEVSARPFRKREIAAMVDSTKMSQMRTASSRYIEYGDDYREGVDWMKCHAIVGVETMIVMAAEFHGTRGNGAHDTNFFLPLVKKAMDMFPLHYVLADKAYLSEKNVGELWKIGVQAVIPVKIKWDFTTKKTAYDPCANLVEWFDKRQAEFHECYRLRVKIESLFSHLKNVADGYCWSRGRRSKESKNSDAPCVAWVNEALCKLIFVNLRTTVSTEEETGYTINALVDNFFPPIPDKDKLIAA